jgi:nucleoid DNA-binding protein
MSLLRALHLPTRAAQPPGQPQAPATPVTLAIQKPEARFEPGTQHSLAVMAFMSDGKTQNYTKQAKWSSSNDALVKMLPGGIAQVGHGAGMAKVTAAAPVGKPADSVWVSVRAQLRELVITPKNPLLEVGKTEIMTATAIYTDGSHDDVTPWVDWSTDKKNVADNPEGGGAWLGKAAGTAKIVATDRETGLPGFTTATVVAEGKRPKLVDLAIEPMSPEIKHGEDVQFRAFGVFADKSRHEMTRHVTWTATHEEVLTIEEKTGLATPTLLSGTSKVTATVPDTNIEQSTFVDLEFPGLVRIEVMEKEMSIPQGENGALNVMGTVRGGGEKRVNPFLQFTVADERVAKVAANGSLVEGLFPGKTQIEAYEPMSEKSATFQVAVLPPNLVNVLVSPAGQVIPIGEQREFSAEGELAGGKRVKLDRPIWSSSDAKTLHVNQNGFATARKRGEAQVIARGRQSDAWGSIGVVCGD